MKWYASYSGVGEYEILSEKQRDDLIQELLDQHQFDKVDHVKWMTEFRTFSEAKKYVMGGIKCDMGDLKLSLLDLKKLRAKK
jgi:hypothetical protein